MTQAYIRAVSMYLPETIEKNDIADRFIEKLGIEERHIVGDGQMASDLAKEAAEALFEEYSIPRDAVDFLLLCTQQPEFFMPTTACILHDKLGLPKQCGALDYGLGCSGYVYGLAMAKGLIESRVASNVLLVTSSLYTKYINKEDKTIRPLFGDGATATLLSGIESDQPYLYAFSLGTDGTKYDSLIIPAGGDRYPSHLTPVVEQVDERGNRRTNYETFMDGQEIMHFTLREVPALVEEVLSKAGLKREELDHCVFHQANRLLLNYVRKKCKLQDVPFFNDCSKEGNIVSGTIPLGITHVLKNTEPEELRNVLLAGFGVGLSWAGCIADLSRISK